MSKREEDYIKLFGVIAGAISTAIASYFIAK